MGIANGLIYLIRLKEILKSVNNPQRHHHPDLSSLGIFSIISTAVIGGIKPKSCGHPQRWKSCPLEREFFNMFSVKTAFKTFKTLQKLPEMEK
jgi:hypothetical protein